MPSKLGFGNSRKKAGKAEYGSSMYYKNPIMLTKAQETLPMNLQKEILAKEAEESNSPMDMYGKKRSMAPMKGKMGGKKSPNPDFDTKGSMSNYGYHKKNKWDLN